MWLKLLIGALLIAFCTLLGYLAAGKYRARKKFYAQFVLFNERYIAELNYSRKPLPDFLKAYEYTGDFGKTLSAFVRQRETAIEFSYLKKDEQSDCSNYFSILGRGDTRSQKDYFTAQRTVLEQKKTESEREAKSHGELYVKLGLLAGLAFVILIV